MVQQTSSLISGEALPHGWRLVVLSEVDSTNDELRRRASEEPFDGLAVVAERQTAGRGRRGRVWASPRGNLYLSLRLRQADSLAETALLSFVSAVALADAIAELAPQVPLALKWPNDVLVAGCKVSGILLESDGPAIIVGIGVNLTEAPEATQALYPPTSLRQQGLTVTVAEFAPVFLRHLSEMVALWRRGGMAAIRPLWLARAHGIGGRLIARLQDGQELVGVFEDLSPDGALLLRLPTGELRSILAADVFFEHQP